MNHTNKGNFFEDFSVGQVLTHATPRTILSGDVSAYMLLYGSRFALQSADTFARKVGYFNGAPVDDLLAFHIAFGRSVPDISFNARFNLGYAECEFITPLYVGDTLTAESEVIGVKQESSGKFGTVYVHTTATNQNDDPVVSFKRWVSVHKRDPDSEAPETVIPELKEAVDPTTLLEHVPKLRPGSWDIDLSGDPTAFEDFAVGDRIDHIAGMKVTEFDHMSAARLYQNPAQVHFNGLAEDGTQRNLIGYGGVAISIARAASHNGLGNACRILGINAGSHVAPLIGGDTVFAWSEIKEKIDLGDRQDYGALRVRTIATRNIPCTDFPNAEKDGGRASETADGTRLPGSILDIDYTVLFPRAVSVEL